MPIKFRMYLWIQDMHHQLSVERSLKTNKIHTCHTNDQWQKGVSLRNTTMHMMKNMTAISVQTIKYWAIRQRLEKDIDNTSQIRKTVWTALLETNVQRAGIMWRLSIGTCGSDIENVPKRSVIHQNGKKSIQREKKRSNGCLRSVRKTMDFDLPGWKD